MWRFLLLFCVWTVSAVAEQRYEVVPNWPVLPEGRSLGTCAGVGVDSHGNVFVFHRNERNWTSAFPAEPIAEPTISVFDGQSGKLLAEWGRGSSSCRTGLRSTAKITCG